MKYVEQLSNAVGLIPDWLAGVGMFLATCSIAALLYAGASKAILATTKGEGRFVGTSILRVRKLVSTALVLLALNLSMQFSYVPERIGLLITKLLSVAVIGLAGWAVIIAIDVTSNIYLYRRRDIKDGDVQAWKHLTQIRVLRRAVEFLIVLVTVAAALMVFEPVRQLGVSLFASAGAAGLIVGLAARPVLSNLIAGIQLAITQPIRINDAVVVEGEWGQIEEITSTYVVIKIWDWRRLVVPLSYFMEKPFQNWSRESSQIIGAIYLQVDHSIPIDKVRTELQGIVESSALWDRCVVNLQVTDFKERTIELRILVSASDSSKAWSLRCEVRERMLLFLQKEHRESLPRQRLELSNVDGEELEMSLKAPPASWKHLADAKHKGN